MIKCTNNLCIYNNKENECYLKNNKIEKGICKSFTSEQIFDKLAELYKKDVENNRKIANRRYYVNKNHIFCDNEFCIYNRKKECVLNNVFKTQDGYCADFTSKDYLDNIINIYENDLENN